MSQDNAERMQQHWLKTRSLTITVLAIWFVFAFLFPWFAKDLQGIEIFGGFRLGYYMIVQGSLIAFVVMIWLQNLRQDAIDDEFGVSE